VAQEKKGSAKRRVQAKRLEQKRRTKRRLSFSLLGFLGLTTLLGFAFFVGDGVRNRSEESVVHHRTTVVHHNISNAEKQKAEVKRKAASAVLVAEEYPEEEIKTGFDPEHLIAKQHNGQKTEPKTKMSTSISAKRSEKKPQLVLIIDDVSQARQIKAIRSLPYHITPSIFPPSRINRHSNLLAKGMKHYLIHLPLESGSAAMNRFDKTLFVDDGPAKIRRRVDELRRLFPEAHYVNNHTGSVFTSNYGAMSHLYGDLARKGFVFVDSRTTGKSVVRRVAADYHRPYIARDVFIDNVQKRDAILAQLKRAVGIAKKRGYAIAIGHPHRATFDALRHAGRILSRVETVYFDDFYRKRFGK